MCASCSISGHASTKACSCGLLLLSYCADGAHHPFAQAFPACKTTSNALAVPGQVFLVFGRSGWIGGLVGELLTQQGARFEFANARLEDRAGILADIERVSAKC